MTIFVSRQFLIASILKLKKEYHFSEQYTTEMECEYVEKEINNTMIELGLDTSFIIDSSLVCTGFEMHSGGIITVRDARGIEYVFDNLYTYMLNDVREVFYDSKMLLNFLIEYKEQQLEKEKQDLEKLKQNLDDRGVLDIYKTLIKREG